MDHKLPQKTTQTFGTYEEWLKRAKELGARLIKAHGGRIILAKLGSENIGDWDGESETGWIKS